MANSEPISHPLANTGDDASVGDRAYELVRSDIIFAKLLPSHRLKLEQLRGEYGVSVGTLRELLNRLAAEGLVVAEGQRGFEVAPVSAQNLREIAALRLLLETHAMELSFERGDMEWEGRVVAAYHKLSAMEQRLLSGDKSGTRTWKRYDWEFHHALISACGSEVLLQTHAPVYDKYLRYQMVAGIFRGKLPIAEHRMLQDAALKRDKASACRVLSTHINDCVEFTIEYWAPFKRAR